MRLILLLTISCIIAAGNVYSQNFDYEQHFKFKVGDKVSKALAAMDSLGCTDKEYSKKTQTYSYFCDVHFLDKEWLSTDIETKKGKVESIIIAGSLSAIEAVKGICNHSEVKEIASANSNSFYFDNCTVSIFDGYGYIFITSSVKPKRK